MPFDASLKTKISPLIDGQVPDFVQADHPKFVQFLKQYYQFLEAAELIVDGIINNIILEKTDTQYLLNEDETKVVTETGVGTTGKFVVGETITGGTSNATAEVLVDDLENTRLFISSQQKFEVGETITGGTSAATASIVTYRANPVATIQKLLDYANPDNTVSVMLDEMFNQFMQSIPNSLASGLSKRNLIKNIKDLYAAKGTSEGHKLFLRMLLDEEADIFLPNQRMLRLSDGNWNKKTVIRCVNQAGSVGSEVIGQTLTGQTSGTTCFAIDAIVFSQGTDSITEFQILQSSIQGSFIEGETLTADSVTSKVGMKFTIQKIVAGSTINKTGILHSSGNTITLDSSIGNNAASVQVDQVSLGSIDEVIIDDVGSDYRIGDVLTFTTSELSTLTAEGFVSVVGGSPLLESNDSSDGYNDYLTLESDTTTSFPIENLSHEDGTSILLDGTDGSSTHAGYYITTEYNTPSNVIIDTYGTENDRIVFEASTSSTAGEITRIFLTDKGSGYSTLPTVSITSTVGTSAKLIPTTKNIGNILSTKNIDSGFNYRSSPSVSVAANFVLKDITGLGFVSGDTLTSHVGTVSGWDATKQILTTTIEDVVRVEMEQDSDSVSQPIELESNSEAVFNRLVVNNVIETNDYDYWKSIGLTDVNLQSRLYNLITEDGDNIITDADNSALKQITLESTSTISDARLELEEGGSILLNGTDGSSSNANDDILYEPHSAISNLQQRKDKFQLNGSGIQLYTAGGWKDEARVSSENDQTTSSHVVFTPATTGDNIILDGTDASSSEAGDAIIMDAFSSSQGDGDNLRLEGIPAILTNVSHDLSRTVDNTDGILLEDSIAAATTNTKEFLILEGIDGNSDGTDVNGFYNIYEAETVAHAGDNSDRIISEASEPLLNEGSVLGQTGTGSGKLMMDSNIVNGESASIFFVLDGTDGSSTNAGDNIILDGISASNRVGNTLVQESGLANGIDDDRPGDDLLHEPESMLAGDILLNATDDDETNAGSNIVSESAIDFVGTTISVAGGSGTIIAANVPNLTILNDFVFTDDGSYQNTDSHISEDIIRVQDGYFYQDFSYEIRIGQSLSNYMDQLKKAVHPAGFAAFGKISLSSLMSAAIPVTGSGLIDAPDAAYSPVLASTLTDIFELKIQKRLGIPKTYREGSYFEELRQENGTVRDSKLVMDGTNFGITLEHLDGVISLESLANDGDNILITASDDGSQDDAGDDIILNGTDASGSDDGDVTGSYSSILLNGTDSDSTNAGSALLLSGTALGVYELIDADGNSLVLNGTDDFPTGKRNRVMHEDGDNDGDNIVTDAFALISITTEVGGPITIEASVSNIRGPYIYTEAGERIISEDYSVSIADGPIFTNSQNIAFEDSFGDNFTLEDSSGVLMSESSAGSKSVDHDVNFIRLLKTKIYLPQTVPVVTVGLSHMALNPFSDQVGIGNIQLEDALRKRGPTINTDRLILNGIEVNASDDPLVLQHGGEPFSLEKATSDNLGVGVGFKDFNKNSRFQILLDGTDGSSSNAGANIASEHAAGGTIVSENVDINLPISDFIRPDLLSMETILDRYSDYGRILLNGSASDNSLGTLDDGSQLILNGTDESSSNADESILYETYDELNKSHDDRDDIFILMEASEASGAFILENNNISYGILEDNSGLIILNGTDGSSTNAGDNILHEIDEGVGQDIILEIGTSVGIGYKLILESQRIEAEVGSSTGKVPDAHWFDNSQFSPFTRPTEIFTRPHGHIKLQDEYDPFDIVLNGTDGSSSNAGSNLVLDGTASDLSDAGGKIETERFLYLPIQYDGYVLLNGTDGSSTNAGNYLDWENGTYSSLLGSASPFLPPGLQAETFDNTDTTTYDNTSQTYDVVEGF